MKTSLLIPICLCFCIKSLIGHPVFDEQKGCLIDSKFNRIKYTELKDLSFFEEIITPSNKQKSIINRLKKLNNNMDDSMLDFITNVQNSSNSLKDFEKKTIQVNGAVKEVLGKDEISLASAIWLYQAIFTPETEDLDKVQEGYDDYLESLSDENF